MNVGLAVTRSARRYPSRVAAFDDVRDVSYLELERRSNCFANLVLEDLKLPRGARLALFAHNRIEVAEVMAGTAKAGLTYVGLNFRLTENELENIFRNSEPALIVVEGESRALLERANTELGARLIDLDDTSPEGYEALLGRASDRQPTTLHDVRPDDDFCIVYTSGTTGTPKGVWFDHARVLQHATVAALEYEISLNTRYLMAIPHNSSVNITLVPVLTMGGAIGFHESRGFDGIKYANAVARHNISHSYLVPTQLYRLLDQLPNDSSLLSSMQTLGYGAAPMAPERIHELLERFGPIFNQLYGMAEIASIGSMLRKSDHAAAMAGQPHLLRSAGQPSYAVDTRVVDDQRNDVGPAERGEVIFGGPHLMKGYYKDRERTAETLIDGWVYSGDIAEVDEEGYIYIVDRKKDIIIVGGHNIAPAEIEAFMHHHPAILEVGVIGIPDPHWGESILAVVALRAGSTASAEEILRWCRDQPSLPTVKTPARVQLVDALPKNAIGKIAKAELRNRYWTGARRV